LRFQRVGSGYQARKVSGHHHSVWGGRGTRYTRWELTEREQKSPEKIGNKTATRRWKDKKRGKGYGEKCFGKAGLCRGRESRGEVLRLTT